MRTTIKKDTTMQFRANSKIKKMAQRNVEKIGLDMSSAMNMYLHSLASANSMSLLMNMRTENGFTVAQEMGMIADTKRAVKNGKRYDDVDKMMDDILNKT